ncbi:hypothetical protein [Nonomuraea sp. NPDC049784]|uniref:hypothetical protein n=1 Tax=Nonomuraea sp. NPDC049784 TaxID=3154361 RepID=UPI0033FA1721
MASINSDDLLSSARDFADRALTAHLENDSKVILFNAAISLEHLCKAYLCSLDPALLMEIKQGQFDSLLHLTGHGSKARKPADTLRTISGREAVTRVKHILPSLSVPDEPISRLINVRDGVVHTGLLDQRRSREALVAYLRLSNDIFGALDVPAGSRWGSHADLVDALISQVLTEIEQDIKQRIAAARLRVGKLFQGIPEDQKLAISHLRQAAVSPPVPDDDEYELLNATCPACADPRASLLYEIEYEPEVDVEGDGQGGYRSYVVGQERILHSLLLECGVCGLRLKDTDELEAAGIEAILADEEEDDGDAAYDAWRESRL